MGVVQFLFDGEEVAVYETIVDDVVVGATQETVAEPLLATAVTAVGALGGRLGVAGAEAVEAGPAPMAL